MTLESLYHLQLNYLDLIRIKIEELVQNQPSEFEYAGHIVGIGKVQGPVERKLQKAPPDFTFYYIRALTLGDMLLRLEGNEPWLVLSTGKRITGHTDKYGDTIIVPLIFVKQITCHEVQEAQRG